MLYSLTGEGWDEDASAVSLRGLDAAVYYRAKGVLNCGHANVRALIRDSLLHWAQEFRVDGFCFANAETLTLGEYFVWIVFASPTWMASYSSEHVSLKVMLRQSIRARGSPVHVVLSRFLLWKLLRPIYL